ncbi:MAG: metalloregulator ArsR/SmtB family transcription factor [Candidatus Aminicenantes bacterium]|nr:metalloregulator ArsR/SmtB family transcription factor [Candidatus Aminicenantes bacterium]
MVVAQEKDFQKQAQILKSLAHPTRLLIVKTLLAGAKCVSDIQELIHASQPNVSQHLNILKVSGIVDYQQMGNLRCYHLTDPEKIKTILAAATF